MRHDRQTWCSPCPSVFSCCLFSLLGVAIYHGSGSAQSLCPVDATSEVHYGPGEDLERFDIGLLREAARRMC